MELTPSQTDKHRAWCVEHNPSTQVNYCKNVYDCYHGAHETLAQLNRKYGERTSSIWLTTQLVDLSEYAGAKEKIKPNMLADCAKIINQRYYYLKYTELMLFFYKFKAGDYGKMYGSVDPLQIMTSLKEFVEERNTIIERHEQEERHKQDIEYRKHAMNREQWEECKRKNKIEL